MSMRPNTTLGEPEVRLSFGVGAECGFCRSNLSSPGPEFASDPEWRWVFVLDFSL